MKTKLLLLALAFGMMSSTCSPEEQPTAPTGCTCKKVFYDYGLLQMNGVTPIWGYTKVGETSLSEMECNLDNNEYTQIDTNSYFKIECE